MKSEPSSAAGISLSSWCRASSRLWLVALRGAATTSCPQTLPFQVLVKLHN